MQKRLLPLLVFLTFINYHLFKSYEVQFKNAITFNQTKEKEYSYDTIQEDHYYYELYATAQQFHTSQNDAYFIYNDKKESHIDYTSTNLRNVLHPEKSEEPSLKLPELRLYIDYYFAPYIVREIEPKELFALDLHEGDIIISDLNLYEKLLSPESLNDTSTTLTRDNFILIEQTEKPYLLLNTFFDEPYYIFRFTKNV